MRRKVDEANPRSRGRSSISKKLVIRITGELDNGDSSGIARGLNSAHERAFMLFNMGLRPAEVARMLNLKKTTSFRYFQQWKRLPPLSTIKYRFARILFRGIGADGRRIIATVLAAELGTSDEEVLAQMRKPWSIKQIITGEWRHWPVKRTGIRPTSKLRAWLLLRLSGGSAREVRYIVEMALNPRHIYMAKSELQGYEILKRGRHDHLS